LKAKKSTGLLYWPSSIRETPYCNSRKIAIHARDGELPSERTEGRYLGRGTPTYGCN
jgi:hypothetical protein